MIVATALQATLNLHGVATIGSAFGGIPAGLPTLQMPSISLTQAISLLGPAFTIALLCAIESLLSAAVADGMADTRHDSNQELIGQGIANIAAPLFGGFAATGAIARTSTNIRNGATSPIAGMAHAATLVAILLVLAPLAAHIPLAALAAILFVVSWQLADVNHFSYILRRAPIADRVILVTTFLLTVFADLVVAVNAGVILAVLHFLRRMAETVETKPVDHRALSADLSDLGLQALPSGIMVYEIAGPMFFGAVEQFELTLKRTYAFPQVLILRLDRVPLIDMTGIQTLDAVIIDLKRQHVRVLLCEANQRVLAELRNATLLTSNDDYFATLKGALSQALAITAQRESAR
jgi:SulP family sulfate permease